MGAVVRNQSKLMVVGVRVVREGFVMGRHRGRSGRKKESNTKFTFRRSKSESETYVTTSKYLPPSVRHSHRNVFI